MARFTARYRLLLERTIMMDIYETLFGESLPAKILVGLELPVSDTI
jgi:hypothetical protein